MQKRGEIHLACFLSTTLCIAQQNLSKGVNVVSKGSPLRMRIVLRISFGMTTRPRSSILITIPVAFIYSFLLKLQIVLLVFVKKRGTILRELTFEKKCAIIKKNAKENTYEKNPRNI